MVGHSPEGRKEEGRWRDGTTLTSTAEGHLMTMFAKDAVGGRSLPPVVPPPVSGSDPTPVTWGKEVSSPVVFGEPQPRGV